MKERLTKDRFELQAEQYQFPYHYLVDLRRKEFGKNLDWGLDYLTYMTKVAALVKKYATTDVLDVGCGDGYLLNHLGRDPAFGAGVEAVGIDVNEKPIKFAQAFAHELPNTSFLAQDIATYDRRFNLITTVETFEHIPDAHLDSFTADINRLLHPGGVLVVSVPSKVRDVIPKHYRHYDLDMLRGYFPSYRVVEVHYVSARKHPLYQAVSFLLSKRRANLNFGIFKRALLRLHDRFTSDVSAEHGAHIVAVFRKP